ncbi:MAG: long-chain-fatty-acid--CoA ligase [Opitutae bacterium]|nr:long-chain-fatty-acid--CoA ligase [Opitutae bacterium]
MMNQPLLISSLIRHADTCHHDTEIVSRLTEGGLHRCTYGDAHRRSRQLVRALLRLGVAAGDRVGTLAWNNYRHFEIYYAVSGMGAICHTVNPRLFAEQIAYIVNHAGDRVVFFDLTFVKLVETVRPLCPAVEHWVVLTDRAHLPAGAAPLLCYEDLVTAESDDYEWPEFSEETAAALCYTSGTTGNPKGVLYSHRSTVLHAYAINLPDSMGLSARDTALPVVPMFHVNAWGLPYAAPMVGAKMVLPGPGLDGASLCELYAAERVTISAGVPTIWLNTLAHLREKNIRLPSPHRTIIGGAAASAALIHALEHEQGIEVRHSWGMTETSPAATINTFKGQHAALSAEARDQVHGKQGRIVPGVELRIVDDAGRELPRDGAAFGDLEVRGHWICREYFKEEGAGVLRPGGWFPTGDVATLDADGYMRIVDRTKDIIKSGGEWISSIELENQALGHPAVAGAAVIGLPHERWSERPLLIVVKRAGHEVTGAELIEFLRSRVAKWWLPDAVEFTDAIPLTATGKISKRTLRATYAGYYTKQPGAT